MIRRNENIAQRQLQPPFGKLPFANGMFANGAFSNAPFPMF